MNDATREQIQTFGSKLRGVQGTIRTSLEPVDRWIAAQQSRTKIKQPRSTDPIQFRIAKGVCIISMLLFFAAATEFLGTHATVQALERALWLMSIFGLLAMASILAAVLLIPPDRKINRQHQETLERANIVQRAAKNLLKIFDRLIDLSHNSVEFNLRIRDIDATVRVTQRYGQVLLKALHEIEDAIRVTDLSDAMIRLADPETQRALMDPEVTTSVLEAIDQQFSQSISELNAGLTTAEQPM